MSCLSRHKDLHHSTKRERGGGTVGSAAVLPTCTLAWTSLAMDYTCGLFNEPTLGLTFFFCALCCLRKVAPIRAVMWINSREGKFSNCKKFRTL